MRSRRAIRRWCAISGLTLLTGVSTVDAQIRLPQVQVPQVPVVVDPSNVNQTVNGVLGAVDPRALRDVRRTRVRNLLRRNRTALEADPRGMPVIRNEVAAFSPSAEALDAARAAGFTIARTRALDGLDTTIVVLLAPQGVTTRSALERLRAADPSGIYDYNHVYVESAGSSSGVAASPASAASVPTEMAPPGTKLGLIDGGVRQDHAAFQGVTIHPHGCDDRIVPSGHGTSVASLLVGRAADFRGAAPGAELFSADVYCGAATGGAVDEIAAAFSWLARERVPVINVSLVGPANATLEQIVKIVIARGHIIVAAVGNDGPSAPPLYPASYPDVIAVTGVDARERVLLEACRGKHVDFAAPGADMSAAATEHSYELVRGTSFAAPIVAGLLATKLQSLDRTAALAAIAALSLQATDLGAKGVDKIYGNGLVGDTLRPPAALAAR
jgi:subtilisin family serine protease